MIEPWMPHPDHEKSPVEPIELQLFGRVVVMCGCTDCVKCREMYFRDRDQLALSLDERDAEDDGRPDTPNYIPPNDADIPPF